MKSCSLKWKAQPQDQFLKGVSKGPNKCPPHPVWIAAQERGERIVKLIGYDCGRADMRRSKNLPLRDDDFDYVYPLQFVGFARPDCVDVITRALGPEYVPQKSSCTFCPASKTWELMWLAANHPDLLDSALDLERRALTGKHSRFDAVEFGADWEDLVRNAERFPSSTTTVGLGRKFAWNHWARINDVVDANFRVRRSEADRERFALTADLLRGEGEDNAQDSRNGSPAARRQLSLDLI